MKALDPLKMPRQKGKSWITMGNTVKKVMRDHCPPVIIIDEWRELNVSSNDIKNGR